MKRLAFTLVVLAALVWCTAASASLADETALAQKYAPVVRLVEQKVECGPGGPYVPMDVNALFGQPTVALRGPWGGGDLVKVGPTAKDLQSGLYEYHLDFPGSALDPGCGYEQWARRITAGRKPAVYAHVASDASHPGKLSLQYWLFYAFNDWNNTHEGDWEMIQLNFDAPDAAAALSRSPTKVGYSQHEGAEQANWGDDKLAIVDGTHPVVYPAAGSHANFYGSALYLGSSASEGVGCDDTRGPHVDVRPVVHTIPSDPAAALSAFPWIGFEGRWGELQRAFFNGPTGPNLKTQWTEPIVWSQDWRDRAYAIPAGGLLGTGATDFFCTAVGGGSNLLRRAVDHPLPSFLLLGGLVLLVLFGLSRATWRPVAPLRLARRRRWGQILSAAARMYFRRFRLFLGMGVLFIPVSVVMTFLQAGFLHASSIVGIRTEGEAGGFLVLVALAVGTTLTLFALALVIAATVRALVEIDEGRKVGPIRAYRMALDIAWPLLGALAIAVLAVSVLASSVILLPIALWLAVRWALIVPVVELERLSALRALRRSGVLVRQEWLKVASLIVVGGGLALLAGPLIGALMILFTSVPAALLNVVAGLVYAVTMPFVALTAAYVYLDTRVRDELAVVHEPDAPLAAEISLS